MTEPQRGMLSNGLWSTVGSLTAAVAVTAASVVTARLLGPEDFGAYVYAVFLYAAAAQLAVWGLPGAVTRFVAVARARGDADAEAAVSSRALSAGAAGSVLGGGALVLLWAVGALPRSSTVLLAALVVLFLGPTQLVVSLLSGRERFKQLALWQVGTGLVNPAATVLVLLAGGGVLAVLAVDVLATALGLAVLLRVARPVRWRLRGSAPAGFWRYSWAYAGLIVLGIVVFQRSEIVILERLRDTSDVALYGIAFGLAQIVARLTGPALGVLTPAFARMHGESAAGDATGVQASVNLALLLGTGLSAVGAAVATPTVTLLYGDRYADAGPATAVLLASSWVVLLNGVLTAVAQARAQMRVLLAVNGVAAVFNVVAGIVLIASSGVMGAAVANAAAQAAVTLGVAVWARRALPEVRYGHLGRVLLPALLAYAVGRAAAPLPDAVAVVVGGVVGAVAFVLAARLTGALDAETLALTRRVLRARRR